MTATNVKVNLSIQPSKLERVLRVLRAFKQNDILDFSIESPVEDGKLLALENTTLTGEELRQIVEEAELDSLVGHDEFKEIFGI